MEITNYNVYNLDNAIKASKYPMAIDPKSKNEQITGTVRKLGGMDRGTGHDNFLHGILVSFDLTCSNKMWVEFQRYHFADIVSSQSTMHRITRLLEEDVFNKYVDERVKDVLKDILSQYNMDDTPQGHRQTYLRLLYNVPSGIELTAHVVTNYGQLKTMWYQRHNHRLPEWRKFCDWILTLPHFSELTRIEKIEKENEYVDN